MKHYQNNIDKITLIESLVICFFLAIFTGCKHVEYVTVPEVHTEHVYHNDTVHHTDSVRTERETIIREGRPEDSLMLAKLGIKLQQNERLLVLLQRELQEAKSELYESHTSDSAKVDSVMVPYPVEKIIKERYVPGFIKFLAWIGGILIVLGLGYIGWRIYRILHP